MENKTKKKGLLERITSSRVFRVMFSRKIIVVCAILLLIMVLIAICAPVIAPYDPNKDDLYNVLKGCSAEHWLGTDSNGRDVLSRIIYGARISFTVGIVAVVISSVIGMALGLGMARLMKVSYAKETSIAIEVAMQNSGLALALATANFAANPLATLPGAIFSVWHNVSGSIFASCRIKEVEEKQKLELKEHAIAK